MRSIENSDPFKTLTAGAWQDGSEFKSKAAVCHFQWGRHNNNQSLVFFQSTQVITELKNLPSVQRSHEETLDQNC